MINLWMIFTEFWFLHTEMVNRLVTWTMDSSLALKLPLTASKAQLEKEPLGRSLVKTEFGVDAPSIAVFKCLLYFPRE